MCKKIIIGGVDVSGCEFINTDEFFSSVCKLLNCDCGSFKAKDCYYKQLQRLRVEYKKFSEYLPIAARLAKRFKTFKKAKGVEYDGILSEWIKENEKLVKDNKALRKTLKKIEEIGEICDTPPCSDFMEFYECRKRCKDETSDNGKRCMYRGITKILEKIEEVKK